MLESFATLKVGIGVEFKPKAGPQRPASQRPLLRFSMLLRFCRVTSWRTVA